jgi:hypothetical protein
MISLLMAAALAGSPAPDATTCEPLRVQIINDEAHIRKLARARASQWMMGGNLALLITKSGDKLKAAQEADEANRVQYETQCPDAPALPGDHR